VLQKTGQKYYGFVDVADIVQFIVDHFGESKLRGEEDFWKNVALEEEFQKATVRDVMRYPLTLRNPFHPIKVGFSLLSAIELLAKEENLHRIPVVDDQRQLKGLVTQSHVIRFINQHINEVGPKKDKPVGEVEGVLKPVVCASVKDEALSAFQKMIRTNVSGIAVIDDSGRIVNNLSLRDLKAIAPDARLFWRLYQTLDAFLRRLKEDYEKKHNRPHSPQTVTVDDTLETVVKKAAEHRIHRVFIINDQRQPIGVISLKDVLREFITDI
jgi:CBS domain-containing protein